MFRAEARLPSEGIGFSHFNCNRKSGEEFIAFAFASVVATRDIIRGEKISSENIWVRRPSGGDFNVLDYESLFGKTAVNDIKGGYQLKSADVH